MRLLILIYLTVSIVGCNAHKKSKVVSKGNANQQQNKQQTLVVDPPGVSKAPPVNQGSQNDSNAGKAQGSTQDQVKKTEPSKPGILTPPAKTDLPQAQAELNQKAGANRRLDRTSVELTFEETLTLYQLGGSLLGQNLPLLFTPQLPIGLKIDDYAFQLKGSFDNAELTLELGNEPLIVISNIKIELEKPYQKEIKIQGKDFSQFGVCIGSECEVLSIATFQAQNKKLVANYPALFKKIEGQYKPAKRLNDKDFEVKYKQLEKDALDPEKMPPQLKVKALFEKNLNEQGNKILESIRQITKNDKVIYSARLFPNILSGTCDPEFKVESTTIKFENICDFVTFSRDGKREAEIFKGQLTGDESIIKSSAGMQVKIKAVKAATDLVKGIGFYELEYRQPKHQTPLFATSVEAQQNRVCQVLVDKNKTYTHCEFIASERVFDGLALEGFFEGPLYIKDDVNGKAVILNSRQGLQQLSQPKDKKPKKPEEATDGV